MPLWPKHFLRFMAKSELYWFPATLVLNNAGAFPVRRGQRDIAAIEKAVELVNEGHVVTMFPEGTRRTKGLTKKWDARPHSGAARIALEAGAPLVPAALKGTDRLSRFGPLRVAYGAPIHVDDLRGEEVGPAARQATERLMTRIAELEASL
jgi:1-acyl-sn-glycerol-3-phosphate acyltransferase